jgi:hypothetical protein
MVMTSVVKIVYVAFLIFLTGCAHYSTTLERAEEQNTISAPIDVVWQKTLELLHNERITLDTFNESNHTIYAQKDVTLWSWGDDITIRLHSLTSNKTVVHIEVHPDVRTTLIGWGHQKRLAVYLFEKMKSTSEGRNRSQ